ncbi:proline dehydrogenase family protein [Virgibacillus halodenitrificans]|uniref:proline dehydrogenase n=1 Tax=Virgibacillus halodenitrificans TaxID=1482 RepID=A0ABR7VN79_VIRHA|nr:proline dehydrogenase [Virgibacillus halodenitrificans]MBD1223363.1 proline dehydrogenase [Virgibacillus halodenitrificans]MCG1026941.1 proline dehydrogenase [Virgibacillus halodenitrificans]MCJ0932691.1 proline dehydrogenase [Virgibacillus halodenitrificans]MEC2158989.1 proline dehydrogenase [Virgibacillus halodenitrificans]MYL46022.1 proline dehydrogenase [Virgibacillus halodenitrificans]
MEQLMRNFFLFLSKNKTLTKAAKNYGLRFGAARFVAGIDIEHAARKINNLNEEGFAVTVDHLGEFIDNEQEARESAAECIHAITVIGNKKLDSEVSLKMTSMGLDISRELVMENMRKILDTAREYNVTVTIDMEDHTRCGKTLEIFKELRKEYDNVGTVLQAYLYRTEEDLQDLSTYEPYLRIVKGAYKEPQEVAFPKKKDVDENYKKLIKQNLKNGHYTAIGTHDEDIIYYVKRLEQLEDISRDQFEFQMLYGIRLDLQQRLRMEGYKVRVYLPYGNDWYGYNMRRLAERPANVLFVLKGVVK